MLPRIASHQSVANPESYRKKSTQPLQPADLIAAETTQNTPLKVPGQIAL